MKIQKHSIAGKDKINEDFVRVETLDAQTAVVAVADGMGGLFNGDKAAQIVCDTATEYITSRYKAGSEREILSEALQEADRTLQRSIQQLHIPMGAAILIAIINSEAVHYSWLGNVRLYIQQNGAQKQAATCLTTDHTLDSGYGRKLLTHCIKGRGLEDDIPFGRHPWKSTETLTICTDGYYENPGTTPSEDDSTLLTITRF